MKLTRLLTLLVLAACGGTARPTSAPAPEPTRTEPAVTTPQPAPATPTPAPAPAPVIREAPRNWQLLADSADNVPGIGSERAMSELLAGKQPKRTVVVAVIDGGVDTAHVDLKDNLWKNPKEVAGNGKDDDGNGYADDVRGWNFIGGRDGKNVHQDALEVTRLQVRCTAGSTGTQRPPLTPAEQERCKQVAADYQKERAEAEQLNQQVTTISEVRSQVNDILTRAMRTDSLTTDKVFAFRPTTPDATRARQVYLQLAAAGITPSALEDAKKEVASKLQYGLNTSFDPRPIVGDDYANPAERRYGNADVMGPDAKHGTHVAGIIGAARGNGSGVDGVAPAVRLMTVRTVPDGDERDKDVANAIRYAVDNGAQVINMSFGKRWSPNKSAVDEAVKYADSRGVLMVHAAGNDGEDLATNPSYPTATYEGGGRAQNWIEVGASSWKPADSLAASFSNYGRERVDVFAPGVDILSTVPGSEYERQSGTSMAAPVVTGLAALLMSYYPELTAADVKRIILASAKRRPDQQVIRPGAQNSEKVAFGTLSATGGVVDAYAAVRMAEERAKQR